MSADVGGTTLSMPALQVSSGGRQLVLVGARVDLESLVARGRRVARPARSRRPPRPRRPPPAGRAGRPARIIESPALRSVHAVDVTVVERATGRRTYYQLVPAGAWYQSMVLGADSVAFRSGAFEAATTAGVTPVVGRIGGPVDLVAGPSFFADEGSTMSARGAVGLPRRPAPGVGVRVACRPRLGRSGTGGPGGRDAPRPAPRGRLSTSRETRETAGMIRLGFQIPNFTYPGVAAGRPVRAGGRRGGHRRVRRLRHRHRDGPLLPTARCWARSRHEMFEAYTLLGALAARTSTAKLGTLVTGVTYRNPAILAKIVTTPRRDLAAGGRSSASARRGSTSSTRPSASTSRR